MTTTTQTSIYTQTRDRLIKEMTRESKSQSISPEECVLVKVSAQMWQDYYDGRVKKDRYLLMAPQENEWSCLVFMPSRYSGYGFGCMTSVASRYVELVHEDMTTESLASTSECDHDCEWDHYCDDDSALRDYYICTRCQEIAQVG